MNTREITDTYYAALEGQGEAIVADYVDDALWTPRATVALVKAGLAACPSGKPAARGHAHQNQWKRSEYLCLDVVIVDGDWSAPGFIAEHENSPSRERIQYNAWKLLSVESRRRVLVAYWNGGKNGCATFEDLVKAVTEVTEAQPGKDILLIGGDYQAQPDSLAALRRAYRDSIVGTHRSLGK